MSSTNSAIACVTPGPMISVADSWHAMYAIHGNQSSRFLLMLLLGPASVMALRAALASLCSDLTGLCLFSAFRFIAISATVSTGGLAVDGEDSCGSVIMLSGGECSVAALGRAPARTVTPGAGADAGGARTGGPGGGPVGGPGIFLEIGVAGGGISHCSVLASGL